MDFIEEENAERLSLKVWKKIGPFLAPLKKELFFALFMMLLSAIVDAVVPLFTEYAVNTFVVPQTTEGIGKFTLVYISVVIFQALTTVLYSRKAMEVEMYMGREMKQACFVHLQKLPLSFYNQTSVGYILARVMSDTNRISGVIAWVGTMSFWHLTYLLGILVAMFIKNWRMALIVLSIVPIILLISGYFIPKLIKANHRARSANSRIVGAFNENITGAKTSKTLVIEDKNTEEFHGITQKMYRASLRAVRLNAVFLPVITFFSSTAVALVLYNSGLLVLGDALDLGVLSAFIAYAVAILDPIQHVASSFSELTAAQVNIERVTSLLSQPVSIDDSDEIKAEYGDVFDPKKENWPRIHGDIEFENVWFRYPDAEEDDYVLKDVSLKIPAGTTIAIVGETGAGKSTMVNLACRFFEPTQGRILIDGVDYRERSQGWLHSNLGYVQQTPHLFSGTIRENLRYGNLDATEEDIIHAAKLVSADVVAERLPDGYDTDVGEGGDRLSTGEKQLISFGRAVIANPPIFVLDEATSSIDTETEKLIQDAISKVLQGRTSFIIAHRLSTIRNADLIIFVDEHGIQERGTHDELMAAEGDYFRLYTAMMIKDEAEEIGFK